MLKKIIAAGAVFAFFACSSDDNNDPPSSGSAGNGSSSSQDDNSNSSSSVQTTTVKDEPISNFQAASIFGTFPYSYTLKAGNPEDLTLFWDIDDPDCPKEEQTTAPPDKCELDKAEAILQNKLTNRYAELHYDAAGPMMEARASIQLKEYNLSGEGDQAALGLDVGTVPKDISVISGAIEFVYTYLGSAHTFRAVTDSDDDFWFVEIASANAPTVNKILISDFVGSGSLDEVPFDLSKVKKFLWVVEFDPQASNKGSLSVSNFRTNREI
jgi:hypothetical protein